MLFVKEVRVIYSCVVSERYLGVDVDDETEREWSPSRSPQSRRRHPRRRRRKTRIDDPRKSYEAIIGARRSHRFQSYLSLAWQGADRERDEGRGTQKPYRGVSEGTEGSALGTQEQSSHGEYDVTYRHGMHFFKSFFRTCRPTTSEERRRVDAEVVQG